MSSAEIRARLIEDAAVIYPGPYLNQLRGDSIESQCQEFLETGVRRIVINFEETELINSIGISILLGVIELVNRARGALVLSNLNASNVAKFKSHAVDQYVAIANGSNVVSFGLFE